MTLLQIHLSQQIPSAWRTGSGMISAMLVAECGFTNCPALYQEPGLDRSTISNVTVFAVPSQQSNTGSHDAGSKKSPGQAFSIA
jgi:hypothetical protein